MSFKISHIPSGEIGAGKTKNTKKVMQYFASVGATREKSDSNFKASK